MRFRPFVHLRAFGALILLLLLAGTAAAQNGDEDAAPLQGIASAGYTHSYQGTTLAEGPAFDDGNGIDVHAGFETSEYLAFQLGLQWQTEHDYDIYFVPATVRAMSPWLLERVRIYGEFGLGMFFSRLRNAQTDYDDERASAITAGGGFEIEMTKDVSGLLYGGYLQGLGSADDYEGAFVGVGLQYRWEL